MNLEFMTGQSHRLIQLVAGTIKTQDAASIMIFDLKSAVIFNREAKAVRNGGIITLIESILVREPTRILQPRTITALRRAVFEVGVSRDSAMPLKSRPPKRQHSYHYFFRDLPNQISLSTYY